MVVVNNYYAGLSFNPDFGTAAQRLVRAVNYFAGTVNLHGMPIVIRFVCLHRNDWITVTALRIASNHVLVYMYIFFHFYLSVSAQVRAVLRVIATYAPVFEPHLVSVASRPELHLQ